RSRPTSVPATRKSSATSRPPTTMTSLERSIGAEIGFALVQKPANHRAELGGGKQGVEAEVVQKPANHRAELGGDKRRRRPACSHEAGQPRGGARWGAGSVEGRRGSAEARYPPSRARWGAGNAEGQRGSAEARQPPRQARWGPAAARAGVSLDGSQ